MKYNRPGLLHILGFIIGLGFICSALLPYIGFLPLTKARIVFSVQYLATGIFIIAFVFHKLKKGDQ